MCYCCIIARKCICVGDDSAENRRADLRYRVPETVQEYDKRRVSMAHILQNLSELNLKAGCYVWGRFESHDSWANPISNWKNVPALWSSTGFLSPPSWDVTLALVHTSIQPHKWLRNGAFCMSLKFIFIFNYSAHIVSRNQNVETATRNHNP